MRPPNVRCTRRQVIRTGRAAPWWSGWAVAHWLDGFMRVAYGRPQLNSGVRQLPIF